MDSKFIGLNTGIIHTNDNCIGCNRCLNGCPVDEANVAVNNSGKNNILVDSEKCILCGKCLDLCTHNARVFIDDTNRFFTDLKNGKNITLLVAPSFILNYPNKYKQVLGYLKRKGIKHIYSVSFGADITTWGYLNYLSKTSEKSKIAQPCPSVVNYMKKYHPESLSKLMPVQSPLMCTAIYLRKYAKITDKLAFLSPCIAKKSEIEDPDNNNYVEYNITFKALFDKLENTSYGSENISDSEIEYGMGSLYSMPGGLRENVEFYIGKDAFVNQVEGEKHAYEYLDYISSNKFYSSNSPLLVDILNCSRGCNYGTGTLSKEKINDEIPHAVHKIRKEKEHTHSDKNELLTPSERLKKLNDLFKDLKLEDFLRTYTKIPVENKTVSYEELQNAYFELKKTTFEDKTIDCTCCGYNTCEEMACAIAKGINYKENCTYYLRLTMLEEHIKADEEHRKVELMLEQSEKDKERQFQYFQEVVKDFKTVHEWLITLEKGNEKSSLDNKHIIEVVTFVSESAEQIEDTLQKIQDNIKHLGKSNEDIVSIARQTNLLSINATIEAARAGTAGKGFSVVAEEVRNLSSKTKSTADTSNENVQNIIDVIASLFKDIHNLNESVDSVNQSTNAITQSIKHISGLTNDALDVINNILEKYEIMDAF